MPGIVLDTHHKTELLDITDLIQDELTGLQVEEGLCVVFCPHTTAGVVINEHADPSVAEDIRAFLDRLVPERSVWTHGEGNAPAHVKAALVGSSVQVPFSDGRLLLGTWQGIFFCEFDGPRGRKIWLHIAA